MLSDFKGLFDKSNKMSSGLRLVCDFIREENEGFVKKKEKKE